MPLAVLKADELGTSETSNGFGAGSTSFGIKMSVAVQAERIIISRHKLFFTELFPAATTQKTLSMPQLVTKSYPTRSYHLLTKVAILSKLLLKTGHTVISTLFGDQRLCSYWLSAMLTHKAGFMPVVSLKFHFAGTRHDGPLAMEALRGALVRIALCA